MPSTHYKILAVFLSFCILFPTLTLAQTPKTKTTIETFYYHHDHLGGTSVVTDEEGEVVEVIDYYPYGESRIDEQFGNFESSKKFTGQEEDLESNLYYYNSRYYNQDIGRFLSPDPAAFNNPENFLTDPQQLNLYSYARNNPMRFIDPFGLSTATMNPIPDGGWGFGDEMGQFNGVVAHYNGIGSSRETYSCVQYAKKYLNERHGINAIGRVYDPKTMWGMLDTMNDKLKNVGSQYNFSQHYNDEGFNLPGEGDLLIWTQGKYGHVMVVTESIFNDSTGLGHVEIIDQNANSQAVRTYDVTRTDSGYSILKKDKTPMAGWFSLNDNNAPANISESSAPTPAPSPAPQQSQPSFFQRIWDGTKKFLKNLF